MRGSDDRLVRSRGENRSWVHRLLSMVPASGGVAYPVAVNDRVHRLALYGFRRLPVRVRRALVRLGAPSHTVGAIVVIVHDDDQQVLLVRQSYRNGWGLPGGLLKRHEETQAAAVREACEEIGVTIETVGDPVVVVEPKAHRVDVVFLGRLPSGAGEPRPTSAEITDVRWFPMGRLPAMQHETMQAFAALERAGKLPSPFVAGAANL